ncbi:molybdenum cofactor biosynthesis protein B, partial [Kytococcus sp. HMSC28H12]|uniref:MogA/MoaB family molybdenum cofactor biosynthesis protein n=2 Tax=Kytococcus TaxID=57499 RepID=UPI001EDC8777
MPTAARDSSVRACVLTVSDRVSRGEREDRSGPLTRDLLTSGLGDLLEGVDLRVVPDGEDPVREAVAAALREGARLVVTTGGTGVSPRDRTPEGTAPLLDREL